LKILESLNWCGRILTLVVVGGSIDLRPERASIGVEARFVGADSFAAFLLVVVWYFAENAYLFVSVGIITLTLLRVSPGVGVVSVACVYRSTVVAMERLVPVSLIGSFLLAEVNGVGSIL
jgi:hypothetical protein